MALLPPQEQQFDPSQPFELVEDDEQQFDPSQPFELVEEEQAAPAEPPKPTVSFEEYRKLNYIEQEKVGAVKFADGDVVSRNFDSPTTENTGWVSQREQETSQRRQDLIPDVVAGFDAELREIAGRDSSKLSALRERMEHSKPFPPFAPDLAKWERRRQGGEHKIIKGAALRQVMGDLESLKGSIEQEEARIEKARKNDKSGLFSLSEWDQRGYAGMVEEYNFKLDKLREVMSWSEQGRGDDLKLLPSPQEKPLARASRMAQPFKIERGEKHTLGSVALGALKKAPGLIPKGLGTVGKAILSVEATLAEMMLAADSGDWSEVGLNRRVFLDNLYSKDKSATDPLPIEREIAELTYSKDFTAKALATFASAGSQAIPYIGVFSAARALGVGAFGAEAMAGKAGLAVESGTGFLMSFNEDGSFNAHKAALMVGLPVAGRAGSRIADDVLAKQWSKTAEVGQAMRNPTTGKFTEMVWKSPAGEAMTKQGISKLKFIKDWGNTVSLAGGLTGNSLYLAALQTPGVLFTKDANGKLIPNPKAEEHAWEAIFNYLPWVLYGIRPRNMKGMPVRTVEAIRETMPKSTVIERVPNLERLATIEQAVKEGSITREAADARIKSENLLIEITKGEVLEGEVGGKPVRVAAIEGMEKLGFVPPSGVRPPGVPSTVLLEGGRQGGISVPRQPMGVRPGSVQSPRIAAEAIAPRGVADSPLRLPAPIAPRGVAEAEAIAPAPIAPRGVAEAEGIVPASVEQGVNLAPKKLSFGKPIKTDMGRIVDARKELSKGDFAIGTHYIAKDQVSQYSAGRVVKVLKNAVDVETPQGEIKRLTGKIGKLTAEEGELLKKETTGVLPNIEQHTLPRSIEGDTKGPDLESGEPVSLTDIRKFLSKALDIPIRWGVGRKRALGFFRPKEEVIRMKAINDVPTIAHEVGHYLHHILFPGGKDAPMRPKASDFEKKFDEELLRLGKATSRGSYTPYQVRLEGVAEFVREWMTDRAAALATAPHFTEFFETQLKKEFPEIWKIMQQAQADIQQYTQQGAEGRVRSMIVSGGKKESGEKLSEWWNRTRIKWEHELLPLEQAMEELRELGLTATTEEDFYQLAVNYRGGVLAKTEYAFEIKQIDYNGNEVGPAMKDILSGVENPEDLDLYMISKRALELHSLGKVSGIDKKDAQEVVDKYASQYEKVTQKLYTWQRNGAKMLVQAGFVSAEGVAKMLKMHKNYVPFYRVMDTISGAANRGGSTGFVDVNKPLKRFSGGDWQIYSPLEGIMKNTILFRDVVERNRVGVAFVKAVESVRGGGRVADEVAMPIKPVPVPARDVSGFLKSIGLDEATLGALQKEGRIPPGALELLESNELAFNIWQTYSPANAARRIFGVWEKGKQKFYEVDSPELYAALRLMDGTAATMLANFPFGKVLQVPTKIVRAGATLTPEFMTRNPARDMLSAAVYSKHGFIPIWDTARGIYSVLKKDAHYWQWVKSGGKYSDFWAADRDDAMRLVRSQTDAPSEKLMNYLFSPIETLGLMSSVMENATRVSEFRLVKKAGKSDLEAANASKDVTLNFSRWGSHGKVMNQLSVFFNASVQDWSKMIREHAGPNRAGVVMRGFAWITVPSLMLWWLGKDDDEIQSLPEWRKSLFWNLNLRPLLEPLDIKPTPFGDYMFSFPKPFLLGHLYGTLPEKALDQVYEKDQNAITKWFARLFESAPLPINPMGLVPKSAQKKLGVSTGEEWPGIMNWQMFPTALKPALEASVNRDTFRRQPIESRSQLNLPPEMRMNPDTSLVAQQAGDFLGASPVKIDHLIRGYTAGLGRYATDTVDWALVQSRLIDIPTPPKKMPHEYPVVRAFVKSPYTAPRQVGQFYRAQKIVTQRIEAFRAFGAHKGTKAQKSLWKADKELVVFYAAEVPGTGKSRADMLQDVRRRMSEVNKAMLNVQMSRTISAGDKRDRLLWLSHVRNTLAEVGVEILHPEDFKQTR